MTVLDKRKLYGIAWNLYDNPEGWVEVTDKCNMTCEGCYRNVIEIHKEHKSFENIKEEVLFMQKERNASEISISGGEPLLHPDILDIVSFISKQNLRAKIFTNGKILTQEFLHKLVIAGLNHITFHVDSGQIRNNNWDNKSEVELNALRQYYVTMCQEERGLTFSFIVMVTKKNLKEIPHIIQWTLENKGKVRGLIFIAIRCYNIVENEKKPEMININLEDNVTSVEIYDIIKRHYPDYGVAAYLGSTSNSNLFKLLFSASVCSSNSIIGSIGPISIELFLVLRHLIYGRYVMGGNSVGLIAKYLINSICFLFDKNIHRALFRLFKMPKSLLDSLYLLSITIKQGNDISLLGDMDLCDGCPEMAYFQGRLVHQCRLDEFRRYGRLITDLRKEN
jgi:organic radical activating enzyme